MEATKSKANRIIILVSLLASVAVVIVAGWRLCSQSHLMGLKPPKYDETLSPKVSAYFASHTPGIYHNGTYDSYGNLLHGPSENYCDAEIVPLGSFEPSPSTGQTTQELQERFREEHADDPYPDKIDRIYASRNPKIIIGGEVED